jgi:hypothetical protein
MMVAMMCLSPFFSRPPGLMPVGAEGPLPFLHPVVLREIGDPFRGLSRGRRRARAVTADTALTIACERYAGDLSLYPFPYLV